MNIDAILENLQAGPAQPASAQLDILDLLARVQARGTALGSVVDPSDFDGKRGAWIETIAAALPRGWRVRGDTAAAWKAAQVGRRPAHVTSEYLARMSFYTLLDGHNDILQFDLLLAPTGHEPYFYHQEPVPIIGPGGRRVKSWTKYRYALVAARSDPGRWRTYRIWAGHHVQDVLRVALDGGMRQASDGVFSGAFWPLPQEA